MKHFLRLMGQLCPISNLYKTKFSAMLAVTTLFMCLIAAIQAPAQTGAAVNMDEIKPLQIGDTIPEELWHLPLQVVNHPEGKETITLNDYRGKLIILDFWATWCGSCVAAMPDLHKLQREFFDEAIILPITAEPEKKAQVFLDSNPRTKDLNMTSVVSDAKLSYFFPHRLLPHVVWLGKDSMVITTSDHSQLSIGTIRDVLVGKAVDLPVKNDVFYDHKQPFQNLGITEMEQMVLNSSLLTRYVAGLPVSVGVQLDSARGVVRASATNVSIPLLFGLVYDELKTMPKNRYIFEDVDSEKLIMPLDDDMDVWNEANRYCFELAIPVNNRMEIKDEVTATLRRLFNIEVTVEDRLIESMVLKNVVATRGKQVSLQEDKMIAFSPSSLVRYLNTTMEIPSVVNEVKEPVNDILLVTDNLSLPFLQSQLASFGLELALAQRIQKVAVFRSLL